LDRSIPTYHQAKGKAVIMKTRLVIEPGRIRHKYPGQERPQPIIADISADGTVYVHYNPEIGNARPEDIMLDVRQRLHLNYRTKAQVKEWYKKSRELLEYLCAGMSDQWIGSHHVGVLTDVAAGAMMEMEYEQYCNEWMVD